MIRFTLYNRTCQEEQRRENARPIASKSIRLANKSKVASLRRVASYTRHSRKRHRSHVIFVLDMHNNEPPFLCIEVSLGSWWWMKRKLLRYSIYLYDGYGSAFTCKTVTVQKSCVIRTEDVSEMLRISSRSLQPTHHMHTITN